MGILLSVLVGVAAGAIMSLIITVLVVTVKKILEECKYRISVQKAKILIKELERNSRKEKYVAAAAELKSLLDEDDVITTKEGVENLTADDIKIFRGEQGIDVKLSSFLDKHPEGVVIDPAAV